MNQERIYAYDPTVKMAWAGQEKVQDGKCSQEHKQNSQEYN